VKSEKCFLKKWKNKNKKEYKSKKTFVHKKFISIIWENNIFLLSLNSCFSSRRRMWSSKRWHNENLLSPWIILFLVYFFLFFLASLQKLTKTVKSIWSKRNQVQFSIFFLLFIWEKVISPFIELALSLYIYICYPLC
jgi:membrane protein insertase Oxa1/YidC/SpoIIIJ